MVNADTQQPDMPDGNGQRPVSSTGIDEEVTRLRARLAGMDRIIEGMLIRMGVPQPLVSMWHRCSAISLTHAIGAANQVQQHLTGRVLWETDEDRCERYAIKAAPALLREMFGTANQPIDFGPSYNAGPTQDLPVVRLHPETMKRHLDRLRWGLIPRWAENAAAGAKAVNVRMETMAVTPMFSDALARRRWMHSTVGVGWASDGSPMPSGSGIGHPSLQRDCGKDGGGRMVSSSGPLPS